MTKRIFSLMFAVIFAVGVIPSASLNASAADDVAYSVADAIKYAKKNWDNGKGLCAEFASACLRAGGVEVYGSTVKVLYDELNGTYGKAYKLKLTDGKKGRIDMSENEGKIAKGDPIFYVCNYCNSFEHVVICNGANEEGYSQDYAHNKAHNGKKTTYTYYHCGGESWTMYSIRMETGPKLYGEKTDVGVPKISSVENGAGGVAIKWGAVKGADKYNIYRKTDSTKLKKIGETKKRKFIDDSAKNGVEYTYVVRAVDGKKVSQYYEGEKIVCLGTPKIVYVKNTAAGVKLKWEKVSSADGYYVYRKASDGSWKTIEKVKGGNKITYTDESVKSSKTYRYTIRAYDDKVNGCYDSEGVSIMFLDTPTDISAKNTKTGIRTTYSKVKGASSYVIYRKASSENWKKIKTVSDRKSASFVDTSVERGESYRYTVKAVKGDYTSAYCSKGAKCKYSAPKMTVMEKVTF